MPEKKPTDILEEEHRVIEEDYLLFPMTNKILNDAEQEDLQTKFEMVEKEVGPDTHTRYNRLAEEIYQGYREG